MGADIPAKTASSLRYTAPSLGARFALRIAEKHPLNLIQFALAEGSELRERA